MNVDDLMSNQVESCRMHDSLARAAQIMWDHDCGCVPVVDDERRVVAMVTDRDICMAALSQGRTLNEMNVESAASTAVVATRPDSTIESAEALMKQNQVRRIPVTDRGGRLVGILSMNDITRRVQRTTTRPDGLSGDLIAETFAAIGAPREVQFGRRGAVS